jgi:hypothetical protein
MNTIPLLPPLRSIFSLSCFLEGEYKKHNPKFHLAPQLMNCIVAAVEEAIKRANKGYGGGWLFGRKPFIEAIREIKNLNSSGGCLAGYKSQFSETIKTNWGELKNQIEAYTKLSLGKYPIPYKIDSEIIDERGWDYPIKSEALKTLFDFCRYVAVYCFHNQKETVEIQYDSGVFEVELQTYRAVQGIRNTLQQHDAVTRQWLQETKEQLDRIEHNTQIAAASKLKDLQGKSKGGKKTAKIKKVERGEDKERNAILDETRKLLEERDKQYPDPKSRPQDKSNNAIYQTVANKHLGTDNKPIMSAAAIKKALYRIKQEPRGKHDRAGKKRGKYNTK